MSRYCAMVSDSSGSGNLPTSSYSLGSSPAQAVRLGVGGVEFFSLLLAGDLMLSRELILVKADTDRIFGSEEKIDLLATRGDDGSEAGSESWRARDGRNIVRLEVGDCQG